MEANLKLNTIKIHVLTDTGVCLSKEVNESTVITKKYLLNFLASVRKLNYLINPLDDKMLILNDKAKMIVLTIKENNLNWKDIDIYHSRQKG